MSGRKLKSIITLIFSVNITKNFILSVKLHKNKLEHFVLVSRIKLKNIITLIFSVNIIKNYLVT
jgi:hypothetical protein